MQLPPRPFRFLHLLKKLAHPDSAGVHLVGCAVAGDAATILQIIQDRGWPPGSYQFMADATPARNLAIIPDAPLSIIQQNIDSATLVFIRASVSVDRIGADGEQ